MRTITGPLFLGLLSVFASSLYGQDSAQTKYTAYFLQHVCYPPGNKPAKQWVEITIRGDSLVSKSLHLAYPDSVNRRKRKEVYKIDSVNCHGDSIYYILPGTSLRLLFNRKEKQFILFGLFPERTKRRKKKNNNDLTEVIRMFISEIPPSEIANAKQEEAERKKHAGRRDRLIRTEKWD